MPNTISDAFTALIDSFGEKGHDNTAAQACAKKLTKDKSVKEAFAPITKHLKYGNPASLMQIALELPHDHALHVAARDVCATKKLAFTPWVSVAALAGAGPQPKRWTTDLLVSKKAPVVYANEYAARVSVWSLENGTHVADLKIPGKSGTVAKELVELDDGTLRCLASDGHVCERKPNAAAFTRVHDTNGEGALASKREVKHDGWAASSDVRYVLRQIEFQPEDTADGKLQRFVLHDAEKKTAKEIRIPCHYLRSGPVFVDGKAILAVNTYKNPDADDSVEEFRLAWIDAATGALEITELDGDPLNMCVDGDGGLGVDLTKDGDSKHYGIDTKTKKVSLKDEPARDDTLTLGDHKLDPWRLTFEDGSTYRIDGDPYKKVAAVDRERRQFVVAGGDPECAVVVIRPFDAGAKVPAPMKAAPKPAPLSWARPGARLTIEIADFDAQDTYTFEVLEANADLVLKIVMDEDSMVAESLRFTSKALDSATKLVAIAQGGADVDVDKPQDKALAMMLSRAAHKKLASGKELAFTSEWQQEKLSLSAQPSSTSLSVSETETPVSTLVASGEGVTLTILDDPQWPLILNRDEGECFAKVVSIDLTNAKEASKSQATSSPASSSAARRFEFTDEGAGKFWEIQREGAAVTVRFGKLGANGQVQQKVHDSEAVAMKEVEKLVREKTKKGYVEAT